LNQLSNILKAARENKNFTQEEVAKKVGIKQRRYGFYESGDREPDFELLVKIADALEIKNITALAQNVPQETDETVVEEDEHPIHRPLNDKTNYVWILEKDRHFFESTLKNNLNLITANLTELLKAQRYDRAQLTALLLVTSKTLATVQNRSVDTVFEETNKAVDDLIRQQM